jgi:hypothetical protein
VVGIGEFIGYARVSDGVVYVCRYDQGRYQSFRMDRDEECSHLECELMPWLPAVGERVCEANDEDYVVGLVLETDKDTSLVRWTGFMDPQVWRNAQLEPECID